MTHGLRAARRLTFILAGLLVITGAGSAPNAVADSRNGYATLGHQWFTVDSNLRGPSHLSAWAIDQYLAENTPLPALGHAFKTAEAKYGVNALYLLAHAMHETAFGTSYIGQRFHNLFGWNAYDRDPTGMASRFPTYASSIDYVASQVSQLYLSRTGKFYGGAPTLRGMHYYASDPMWGVLIARIANGIVLSTLAHRNVTFETPVVADTSTGEHTIVTIATKTGRLPDGLEAAYRFVPVAIVEAGSPTGAVPPGDPSFTDAGGESRNGQLRITVDAPKRAGRYRLELELRDSDGSELTEFGVPAIPDAAVRIFGSDAVSFDVAQTDAGLAITVSNEGRRSIAPKGAATPPAPGTATSATPTTLSGWLVANDGSPVLLGTAVLDRILKPGSTWSATLPNPDPALLPAVLVLRLEVGGEPGRLGGSPPGVFRLAADPNAAPTPVATPAASDPATAAPGATPAPSGPSATDAAPVADSILPAGGVTITGGETSAGAAATSPTSSSGTDNSVNGDPNGSPTPRAQSVPLAIGALTPIDAATRTLLNPTWKPSVDAGRSAIASARAKASSRAPTVSVTYIPYVNPKQAGTATVRITNIGTAPFVAAAFDSAVSTVAAPTASPSDPAVPVTEQTDTAQGADAAAIEPAVLHVTAIPVWGPATEPVVLRVPLIDIPAGRTIDVGVSLPGSDVGQSTYLVVARITRPGEQPSLGSSLFWLRTAPASPAAHAVVTAPVLSSVPAKTGSTTRSTTPAAPSAAPSAAPPAVSTAAPSAAPAPTRTPRPTSGSPAVTHAPATSVTPSPAATPRPTPTPPGNWYGSAAPAAALDAPGVAGSMAGAVASIIPLPTFSH